MSTWNDYFAEAARSVPPGSPKAARNLAIRAAGVRDRRAPAPSGAPPRPPPGRGGGAPRPNVGNPGNGGLLKLALYAGAGYGAWKLYQNYRATHPTGAPAAG